MDFIRGIRDLIFGRTLAAEQADVHLQHATTTPAVVSHAEIRPDRRFTSSDLRQGSAEDFITALQDAVESEMERKAKEEKLKELEQELHGFRSRHQAREILLDLTLSRLVPEAELHLAKIQQIHETEEQESDSNPASTYRMLVRTRSDLRTLESRIARAMDRLCRDVQGWADETMPVCKIGQLQANQWFFFNLIFCREKAQRTQIAREKVRDANKSWTLAMQKSNEVVRRQRLSGGSDPEELLHVQTCAANVKSAEQIFNNRREDLQFHILRQKETESSFLTNDGVKALTESGLRTPSSPVSSNEDMSYYIDGGGDDQQPIPEDPPRHPLLMRVETTRRELARGIQMLQKKIEAYSRGVANYSVIKSSGAKEAWDVDYKKRSKYDIETFREKMEKAIEKADIAYQKARKDALEAGILESELPLTPSGLAGEADEKTKKIVSRDSNASDLKGRVTWDDKRDRRRIRKWGRKVARGRVEKSSPESPARFPITSPARSIGSIGPPSPWENPNIRWIRRENETRRRLREQAGKLREKKRREVAREHLRNGGRQQELVKRDPWTDEMEDVQFGMAGEDSIYGGPDSEPDGGEGWRKATETTNPLRLPLYPSAADRRRRRRPQA